MNINNLGPMQITAPQTFKLPWGKGAASVGDPALAYDLFREADVRELINVEYETARSFRSIDNQTTHSQKDLDPTKDRTLVKKASCSCDSLKGGTVEAIISVQFDPGTDQPSSLDAVSREQNFTSQARWKLGEFQSLREERVLADGSREILKLVYDSANGLLSYSADLVPASLS